jgi:WhiB family transcriptional regulator, redox-sensing transcriptional regulator
MTFRRAGAEWCAGALAPLLAAEEDAGRSDPLSWQDQALCAQADPEAFFPEKGGSTAKAKRVCLSCPVRRECLEFALENREGFGIWGGLSERERRGLKPGGAPGLRRCRNGLHDLTPENTTGIATCRACKTAADGRRNAAVSRARKALAA